MPPGVVVGARYGAPATRPSSSPCARFAPAEEPGYGATRRPDRPRRSTVRTVLVGRDPESARLTELVEGARHGSAGSLVVLGEPGIGKSALLEHLVTHAGVSLVLRTQGLEVEAPLAFA